MSWEASSVPSFEATRATEFLMSSNHTTLAEASSAALPAPSRSHVRLFDSLLTNQSRLLHSRATRTYVSNICSLSQPATTHGVCRGHSRGHSRGCLCQPARAWPLFSEPARLSLSTQTHGCSAQRIVDFPWPTGHFAAHPGRDPCVLKHLLECKPSPFGIWMAAMLALLGYRGRCVAHQTALDRC